MVISQPWRHFPDCPRLGVEGEDVEVRVQLVEPEHGTLALRPVSVLQFSQASAHVPHALREVLGHAHLSAAEFVRVREHEELVCDGKETNKHCARPQPLHAHQGKPPRHLHVRPDHFPNFGLALFVRLRHCSGDSEEDEVLSSGVVLLPFDSFRQVFHGSLPHFLFRLHLLVSRREGLQVIEQEILCVLKITGSPRHRTNIHICHQKSRIIGHVCLSPGLWHVVPGIAICHAVD